MIEQSEESSQSGRRFHLPDSIHSGMGEGIFSVLPERVLSNFQKPNSENALLWNSFYRYAHEPIPLEKLIGLSPLWGTVDVNFRSDLLVPYFWGCDVNGGRLSHLDESLGLHTTHGPPTEVDLFLVGNENIILVEVKNLAGFGRCSRYTKRRCPEIYTLDRSEVDRCQYWIDPVLRFSDQVDFGELPFTNGAPACHRHYQLGRTLVTGLQLASRFGLMLWIWVILPQNRWRALESDWLDFTNRIIDAELWRRMRVMSWETILRL